MRCRNDHETPEDLAFCPECGVALYETCPSGHMSPGGTRFCGTCGEEIEAQSGTVSTAVSTAVTGEPPAGPASKVKRPKPAVLYGAVAFLAVMCLGLGVVWWMNGSEGSDDGTPDGPETPSLSQEEMVDETYTALLRYGSRSIFCAMWLEKESIAGGTIALPPGGRAALEDTFQEEAADAGYPPLDPDVVADKMNSTC